MVVGSSFFQYEGMIPIMKQMEGERSRLYKNIFFVWYKMTFGLL